PTGLVSIDTYSSRQHQPVAQRSEERRKPAHRTSGEQVLPKVAVVRARESRRAEGAVGVLSDDRHFQRRRSVHRKSSSFNATAPPARGKRPTRSPTSHFANPQAPTCYRL